MALLWAAVTVALLRLAPEAAAAPAERVVLVAYLYGFAGMILGLWVAARLLQRRSFAGLIGPEGFAPGDFLLGVAAMAAIGVASGVVWLALAAPTQAQPVAAWAAWLPFALPALLVQTAAEELVFRGYLMQGLAARFRSSLVWWLLPALLFGLLHWSPQVYGADAWLVVLVGHRHRPRPRRRDRADRRPLARRSACISPTTSRRCSIVALPSDRSPAQPLGGRRRPVGPGRDAPPAPRRPRRRRSPPGPSGWAGAPGRRLHSRGPRFYLDGRSPPREPGPG